MLSQLPSSFQIIRSFASRRLFLPLNQRSSILPPNAARNSVNNQPWHPICVLYSLLSHHFLHFLLLISLLLLSHLSAGGMIDDRQSPQFDPYVNLPPARHPDDYQNAWDREANAGEEDLGPVYPAPGGGTLSRADKFGTVELYQDDRPTSAIGSDYRAGERQVWFVFIEKSGINNDECLMEYEVYLLISRQLLLSFIRRTPTGGSKTAFAEPSRARSAILFRWSPRWHWANVAKSQFCTATNQQRWVRDTSIWVPKLSTFEIQALLQSTCSTNTVNPNFKSDALWLILLLREKK